MKLIAFVLAATATLVAAADCPVCIIGAGPAGLSAASRLESKGKQTVVFEKQATVGGKCQAYYENNTFHPLGALLYTNTTYRETLKIIDTVGVPSVPFLGNLPKWDYDWKTGALQPAPILTSAFNETLASELPRYISFWETEFAPNLTSIGYKAGVPEAFTIPFSEWLTENSFEALPIVFNEAMVSFGYGDGAQVPTVYMLQFFAPDVVLGYIQQGPGYLIDFHEVFTRFSKTIKGPINLNATIQAIDRRGVLPTITWVSSSTPFPRPQIQKCSAIILAFPPTLASFEAANLSPIANETAVFSTLITSNYFSAAVSMSPDIPADALYAATNASTPTLPPDHAAEPIAFVRLWNTSRVVTSWSWGGDNHNGSNTFTEDFVRQLLVDTLSKLNKGPGDLPDKPTPVTAGDVKGFTAPVYFPHFGTDDLTAGLYGKLGALQGQAGTYYASGLNGFETVEFAIRAGLDVVDSYF